MSDQSVHLTPSGPPETVLDDEPAEARHASPRRWPRRRAPGRWRRWRPAGRDLDAWARLGELGTTTPSGTPRSRRVPPRLDRLRQNGWRARATCGGSTSRTRFLRALDGLRAAAAAIGETDEEERCALFLRQLDPAWPPADR
jgi:hypothetical protein